MARARASGAPRPAGLVARGYDRRCRFAGDTCRSPGIAPGNTLGAGGEAARRLGAGTPRAAPRTAPFPALRGAHRMSVQMSSLTLIAIACAAVPAAASPQDDLAY